MISKLLNRGNGIASRLAAALFLLAAVLLPGSAASAHPMQIIPIVVVIRPQKTFLTVQYKGNGSDLMGATGMDSSAVDGDDFTLRAQEALVKYFNDNLMLKQGKMLQGVYSGSSFEANTWDPTKSSYTFTMRYPRDVADANKRFEVKTMLLANQQNAPTILSVGGFQQTMQPGESTSLDPKEVSTNLMRNIKDFTLMGMEHIFTGPDHMLFIVALLLVSTSFWSLAKTLTGFTVSHSITLIISALYVIPITNRWVDIFIALSIVYVGAENVYLKSTKHRFIIAAAFGLVHGFGFSTALREIGLPDQGLAWCLLSFNMGVEIAQVIICSIAFPILVQIRKKFDFEEQYGGMGWTKAMHVMSWGVVGMGGYWFLDRLFSK